MSFKVFTDILHGFMQNICKTFNGKHISHLIDFESMAIIPSNQVMWKVIRRGSLKDYVNFSTFAIIFVISLVLVVFLFKFTSIISIFEKINSVN